MNARFVRLLEDWFEREQRSLPWRIRYDPYEVWVSEVMAQQTRLEVVIPYWSAFLDQFPSMSALANAPLDAVLGAWSGLGYYRRARLLHEAARDVVANRDGELPREAEELRTISGIGPYTAGAISSIAFDRPAAVVDGNILRVLARVAALEPRLGSPALSRQAWSLADELVKLAGSPRMFNQAIMELGATVCTPKKPSCERCPVNDHCIARRSRLETDYPRPKVRASTVNLDVPVYVIRDSSGRILLLRRSGGGKLDQMFRLPGDDPSFGAAVHLTEVERGRRLGVVRHTITNRRIRFEVFEGQLKKRDRIEDEVLWIGEGDLEEVPHPSWVRKVLRVGGLDG